jgi:hypothetical protein
MAKGKYQHWLTDEGLQKIETWARAGLIDGQIAHNMGICRDTLNEWQKTYADISDTLKRGKETSDRRVENALFKRATGFQYTESIDEVPGIKVAHKRALPDVTACIYWLKNRRPEKWRDVKVIAANVKNGFNPTNEQLDDEIRRLTCTLSNDGPKKLSGASG